MKKKKAIIIGISIVLGTLALMFTAFLFTLWMLDRSDEFSRGG